MNQAKYLLIILFSMMMGLAFWCRITSLETAAMSGHDADGAFFGVQAERLAHGQSIELKTGGGKPVDPVYIIAEVPFHWFSRPSFVIQRLPAVCFGLLAVVLLYRYALRTLDRETALIAAGLLACLPIAIIYSRFGWEYSEVPAVCVLVLAGASANRFGLLLLSYMFGLYISPTMVVMAPVPLCILGGRYVMTLREKKFDEARSIVITALVLVGVTILYGSTVAGSSRAQAAVESTAAGSLPSRNLKLYLTLYMRQVLGFCQDVPSDTGESLFRIFWGSLGVITVAGIVQMVRQRRWDFLGFPTGWLASVVGYYFAVGPAGFHPQLARYGLFLTVPMVLAVACLLRCLLISSETRLSNAVRCLQISSLFVLGFALLATYKTCYFDSWSTMAYRSDESFWTLKSETPNTLKRVSQILERDAAIRSEPHPTIKVFAQDWWSFKPIQFFTMRSARLEVSNLEAIPADQISRHLGQGLEEGGYVVGIQGQSIDQAVRALYPHDKLTSYDVCATGYIPPYVVHRLRR